MLFGNDEYLSSDNDQFDDEDWAFATTSGIQQIKVPSSNVSSM
jgi:hypothetical protein